MVAASRDDCIYFRAADQIENMRPYARSIACYCQGDAMQCRARDARSSSQLMHQLSDPALVARTRVREVTLGRAPTLHILNKGETSFRLYDFHSLNQLLVLKSVPGRKHSLSNLFHLIFERTHLRPTSCKLTGASLYPSAPCCSQSSQLYLSFSFRGVYFSVPESFAKSTLSTGNTTAG